MFELLTKNCNYCNSILKTSSLQGNNDINNTPVVFCDLICAKIYNDNIAPVSISQQKYNKLYANASLNKSSESIYAMFGNIQFKQLPLMKNEYINESLDPKEKINYKNSCMKILSKQGI
jgi:hypothetical protein